MLTRVQGFTPDSSSRLSNLEYNTPALFHVTTVISHSWNTLTIRGKVDTCDWTLLINVIDIHLSPRGGDVKEVLVCGR
jgi:hypothetical protein